MIRKSDLVVERNAWCGNGRDSFPSVTVTSDHLSQCVLQFSRCVYANGPDYLLGGMLLFYLWRLMFNGYGGRKSLSSSSICLLLRRIQIWCFGTRKREKLTVDNYNACQSFTEQFSATAIDLLQHFQWYALLLISLLAFYSVDDSLLHGSTSRILIDKHPNHSTSGYFDRVSISFL